MAAPQLTTYQQGQGVVTSDNLNTFVQSCDDVVQLRSFVGVSGLQVFARGTVYAGDGGGGMYYWSGAGGYVDNGVTVIVPNGVVAGAWLALVASSSAATQTTYPTAVLAAASVIAAGVQQVQTLGYYTVNDQGGAIYARASSGVFQSVDGAWWAYLPDTSGTYNAKGFGARGDDVHDDTSALQAAITAAAGSLVFIPAGMYIVSGQIGYTTAYTSTAASALGKGLHLAGAGMYNTIIDCRVANSSTIIASNAAPYSNPQGSGWAVGGFIRGMTLLTNSSQAANSGVELHALFQFRVEEVGCVGLSGSGILITENTTDTPSPGFPADASDALEIKNCRIDTCNIGIECRYNYGTTQTSFMAVRDCTLTNNTRHGFVWSGLQCVMENVAFSTNGFMGGAYSGSGFYAKYNGANNAGLVCNCVSFENNATDIMLESLVYGHWTDTELAHTGYPVEPTTTLGVSVGFGMTPYCESAPIPGNSCQQVVFDTTFIRFNAQFSPWVLFNAKSNTAIIAVYNTVWANYDTLFPAKTGTVTISIASPAVISFASHGFIVGQPVVFTTTGALPTGLTSGTTYYVIAAGLTTSAFEVSATQYGTAVNTSGSQSGTQTCTGSGAAAQQRYLVAPGSFGNRLSDSLDTIQVGGANGVPGIVLANGANNNIALPLDGTVFTISGPTASFSVTGFANGVDGQQLKLLNTSGQTCSIVPFTGSLSTNQISTNGGGTVTLNGGGCASFIYAQGNSHWFLTGVG